MAIAEIAEMRCTKDMGERNVDTNEYPWLRLDYFLHVFFFLSKVRDGRTWAIAVRRGSYINPSFF